jgi:uncharacterized YccA/Bax inhibitor family protein
MAIDNPAYSRNKGFTSNPGTLSAADLQAMYDASPNAVPAQPMTIEGSVVKTLGLFVVLVIGAAAGWIIAATNPALGSMLLMGSMLVGFVLAMVNIFKKEPSAPLVVAYAAVQGVFIGVISFLYNSLWDGIVIQAVLATLVVVGVTLALFASGKVRASPRATKIFLISMVGYVVFSLVNMLLVMFGAIKNPYGIGGIEVFGIPLGIVIGVLVVIMAAYSLVLDFDFIQKGAANRIPKAYEWSGAFGVMVTVIWLYLEILRMLAISRN